MSPDFPLLEPVLTLLPPQAGGGGSFGGGGGGGGGGFGGGGGGDGIGVLIYFLLRLVFEYPVVGIPLLVGVAAIGVVGTRRGWWKHQQRVIRLARPQRQAVRAARSAEALKRTDPGFDENAFLQRVRKAFDVAQDSWCRQDLEALRCFVSDGVLERFSLQIEEQKQDGWRQGMEGTQVTSCTIAHVEPGKQFDVVTTRIAFRSKIDRRDLQTGKSLRGSELPRDTFAECWTFVRRRGAKTVTEGGLIEGKCPNCGAPLALRQSTKCEHCEALVRSGQFDWVLTEITQASEWRPENEQGVRGLAAYQESDPGLSVQLLEDRASVAFWRKCAADRSANVDSLRRIATSELCERYAERLKPLPGATRVYRGDCAVGSVRTLAVRKGEEADRAYVEVVWDGRRARDDGDGPPELEKQRAIRRTILAFERATGKQTRIDDSFTTAHCQNCGAHDLGGTRSDCAYCGAPRTGDGSTWLLADLGNRGTPEGLALERELQSAPAAPTVHEAPESQPLARVSRSAEDLILWAAALVQADGVVSGRERRAVQQLAQRSDVSSLRVDMLLASHSDEAAIPRPDGEGEALEWLRALTDLAMSDGTISNDEKRFLHDAGQRLGVGKKQVRKIVGDVRGALYRESKEARRRAR